MIFSDELESDLIKSDLNPTRRWCTGTFCTVRLVRPLDGDRQLCTNRQRSGATVASGPLLAQYTEYSSTV